MASKVFNLDDLIAESVHIKMGDPCPYCDKENAYINTPENDITKHILMNHKPDFVKIMGMVEKE